MDTILSIGITAHGEGFLAHKTMQSIFYALKKITVPYEILIHIDNGTEETKHYFSRYKNNTNVKIIESSFKDLGMSRNRIVAEAKGKYLFFLDADDMISSNWFKESLKVLEDSGEDILVHAEVQFNFGNNLPFYCTIRGNSYSKAEDALILAGNNRWSSSVMGKTSIFKSHPYLETKDGIGYEDYSFNTNTIGDNIKHYIVPKTVMFYRQKEEGSLLASSFKDHVVQPYVKLLDVDYIKSIPKSEIEEIRSKTQSNKKSKKNLKQRFIDKYIAIRSNPYCNAFISPIAGIWKKISKKTIVGNYKQKQIPNFIIEEWAKINAIESKLYPTEDSQKNVNLLQADDYEVGLAYYDLISNIPKKPDYTFFVPWIIPGGADMVLINHLNAIKELYPEQRVAVIATDGNMKSSWKDKIPDNAFFLDFGAASKKLNPIEKEVLFSRLIVQLGCKNIHIINSSYAFYWVKNHKNYIKANCIVDASIFSLSNLSDPLAGDFANNDLLDSYSVIRRIYSDNQTVIDDMIRREGFELEKCKVIYQPVDYRLNSPQSTKNKKLKILYAGRISPEKNPELLMEIGKKLNPKEATIDVYGVLSDCYKASDFDKIPSLHYCGSFNGINSINTDEYDAFLHISSREGMPNVLLEASAMGLPIIATDIGGVSEFIVDKKTGILVKDIKNPDAYIEAILNLKETDLLKYVKNAQSLIKKRHSWNYFLDTVKDIYD